jgi:polyhydroxyalkanoate synthesis regulator phasin
MILGLYPVRGVVNVLWSDESHTLVDIDPVDGDVAVYELSDYQFTDLTVEGSEGEEVANPATSLHEVRLSSGGTGYEVESYDPETNTASVSWMAGATNIDVRRHKRMVDVIIEELSVEAERSLDEIIEAPELMRQHGSEVVNEMIQIAEGERSPGEGSVAESIGELTREQHDQTDSLISDRGIDDIEARIEELENGSSNSEEAQA